MTSPPTAARGRSALAGALAAEEEGLLTCVHCGFCLPACPTYTRLGDENDSPRGRLYLMRAVVEGRLDAGAAAFQEHIDRCLGCRACEPVCPSGVPYGRLLELAREEGTKAASPGPLTRLFLRLFGSRPATRLALALGALLRATGLPAWAARRLPSTGPWSRVRLGSAMLAASAPWRLPEPVDRPASGRSAPAVVDRGSHGRPDPASGDAPPISSTKGTPSVALLTGCVQEGLFAHVHRATVRVLEAHGLQVREVSAQGCCGAIHAHGGDLRTARELARRNVEAFEDAGAEVVVVNAAGCGAAMKDYGHLLSGDGAYARRARALEARVRDVSELLVELELRRGAPLPLRVAYDAPCHLLHAQGVEDAPIRLLRSVPELELVPVANAHECCGGAGIYGITHPELGGWIGGDKVDAVLESGADVVATGNPGCIMQIGAGLRMRHARVAVVHPVELLDESYRRGGVYR